MSCCGNAKLSKPSNNDSTAARVWTASTQGLRSLDVGSCAAYRARIQKQHAP